MTKGIELGMCWEFRHGTHKQNTSHELSKNGCTGWEFNAPYIESGVAV